MRNCFLFNPQLGKSLCKLSYQVNLSAQAVYNCTVQPYTQTTSSTLMNHFWKWLSSCSYCTSSRSSNIVNIHHDRMTQVTKDADGFRTLFTTHRYNTLNHAYRCNVLNYVVIPACSVTLSDVAYLPLGHVGFLFVLGGYYIQQALINPLENTYKLLVNDQTNEVKFTSIGLAWTRDVKYSLEDVVMTYSHSLAGKHSCEVLCRRRIGLTTVCDFYTFSVKTDANAIEIQNYFNVYDLQNKIPPVGKLSMI